MKLALFILLSLSCNAQVVVRTVCGPGGPVTPSSAITNGEAINAQTGTNYTYQNSDCGKLVTHSSGSPVAATLLQANATTFRPGWFVDVQNVGTGTVTITTTVSTIDGAATLTLTTNQGVRIVSNGINYSTQRGGAGTSSSGGIPSGLITMTLTSCPSGWSQVAALDGVTIIGTLAAHGDVGTTGGSDSITPGGTNTAPAFTGNSGTVPAETFTGNAGTVPAQIFTGSSATTSSNSAGTPAGSNTLGAFAEGAITWPAGVPTNASGAFSEGAISWPIGVPTFSGGAGTVPAQTFTGTLAIVTSATSGGTPAGTIASSAQTKFTTSGSGTLANTTAARTFVGSALATHTHTLTPAGTNGTVSFTPTGTVAWPAGVPTIASGVFTQPTISWPMGVPTIASGVFTQPTFTGSALMGHTHTLTATGTNGTASFTPAGTNGTASFTPSGTNSAPIFSGNSFDNRSSFVKAIFCSAP